MEKKICSRCQSENDVDARFCEICGWKLSEDYNDHQSVTYKINFTGEIRIEKIQ